ncbi:MAG: hypothetical protein LC118_08720 [Dehalococcoidia bacterium]|nr:hypothetical protein [Dehalococcoidia bacterium]
MDTICALVPRFLIALARRDDPAIRRRPVIIGRSSETRGTVLACSDEAAQAGIVAGMPLSRALVLCPSAAMVALCQEEATAAERAFLALLADRCPAVEGIEPGHVHADVRGLARMNGLAPAAYLADLQESLAARTMLPVHLGGATAVFAAHAAAAYLADPVRLLRTSDVAAILGGLPVEALPAPETMVRRMRLFGLERLEQVGRLPPAALQAQFGPSGLLAWRLIHGEERGRIVPARDEVLVVERIELPAKAVASTPLVLATEILLQRSMRRREIDGRSVRRADWAVELENGERQQLRFVFREPTADQSRMLFIARNGIERLDLAAPATAVGLTLSGICSEYVRQERLWETGPRGAAALGEAIEQLTVREGSPQVYRVVEVEPWSRIPERQRALAAYYP